MLNEAIIGAREDGTTDRLTTAWLVPAESIDAGESLVGTPSNELIIGLTGQLSGFDPATQAIDFVGWEVMRNTMSGLLMQDAENNLIPVLAEDYPLVSDDKLEYTFTLRPGLTFPDGSEFTAEDVKYALERAARLGSFEVNRFLKDADGNGFADADAVQVIDPLTVKIVLDEPTSYFLSVLATPPYYVISQNCQPEALEPGNVCDGIGAYTITQWEPNEQMRLKANPQWPGTAPAFENIQIRFYDDRGRMRGSLENSAIDVAWTGLSFDDGRELRERSNFRYWEGPSTFKSYLVFEQGESPLSNARIREAIAHTVDRVSLANDVFDGSRKAAIHTFTGCRVRTCRYRTGSRSRCGPLDPHGCRL